MILGAGGASRGVLAPLLEEKPQELVIANRTLSKAEALVELCDNPSVSASSFEQLKGGFDIIINATAASLQGELPPLPEHVVSSQTCSYDMMYGAEETIFNRWCRELGAHQVLDGLGMLVEQAAEQFAIWRGVRPSTDEVLAILRNEL